MRLGLLVTSLCVWQFMGWFTRFYRKNGIGMQLSRSVVFWKTSERSICKFAQISPPSVTAAP